MIWFFAAVVLALAVYNRGFRRVLLWGSPIILLIVLLAWAGSSDGAEFPLSTPVPGQTPYDSLTEAESEAVKGLVACSRRYECGTAIYQAADGYHFTAPVSQRQEGEVIYTAIFPAGSRPIEFIHTHPGTIGFDDLHLSRQDRAAAAAIHLPVKAWAINFGKWAA